MRKGTTNFLCGSNKAFPPALSRVEKRSEADADDVIQNDIQIKSLVEVTHVHGEAPNDNPRMM